jgi:Uma2 family endonuclease
MTTTTIPIPASLIYEEWDGKPIYRKGYKSYMYGFKSLDSIMGTSTLQWFITLVLTKYLNRHLSDNFLAGSAELGIHLTKNDNYAVDIAIYEANQLSIGLNSLNYTNVPPKVAIEVDIKIEGMEGFSEDEYYIRKTENLLSFGVEKVIWVFSSTKRVLVAENQQRWEFIRWDESFEIIKGLEVNLWNELLKNGLQV